jgi:hypothetical protein
MKPPSRSRRSILPAVGLPARGVRKSRFGLEINNFAHRIEFTHPQVLAGQSGFASRSFFDRSSSACKTGFSAPSWNRTDSKLSNGAS